METAVKVQVFFFSARQVDYEVAPKLDQIRITSYGQQMIRSHTTAREGRVTLDSRLIHECRKDEVLVGENDCCSPKEPQCENGHARTT